MTVDKISSTKGIEGMIDIYKLSNDPPVTLAASELRKYLARVTKNKICVRACKVYDSATPGIWVGTFEAFPHIRVRNQPESEFDDEIYVNVAARGGVISGVNPRSVLLAAYRYLRELGFRWVRPGKDGELTPSLRKPLAKRISLREKPAHRHRCVCIEGAVGWEHVRDMIDWIPKLGFNSYFVQFRESYEFFVRWYHHEHNPRIKKERFTVGDARKFTSRIWDIARKRGLIIHMVGHGWTCEPFGVPCLGWKKQKKPVPQRIRKYLAKINGVRDWRDGVAGNTQLCYSSPKVREIMVNSVADYAQEHPHVPVICFVFADGFNNHCECPKCRRHLPSDLYVKICNQIDAELTRRNLPTKITFDIYLECLWPPKKERLKNPDRFIMIFAPITRTYTNSLKVGTQTSRQLPTFVRNRLMFPTNSGENRGKRVMLPANVSENLDFLRHWQKIFKGDSFLFDYHLMWDHVKDPGHYRLAETLHEDINQLQRLRLNGLISCQVHRCSLPTSLIMETMGQALWDRKISFEEIANDYYRATFGPEWRKAKRYTRGLSDLFDPPFFRGERSQDELPQTVRKLGKIPSAIGRFSPTIEANITLRNQCHARSWRYLKEHAAICLKLAPVLKALAQGERDCALEAAKHLFDFARQRERQIHRVFDVWALVLVVGDLLKMTEKEMNK